MTGTADDDTFYGDAGQNSQGFVTNALSTGDRIDGGSGTDTLEATLISDGNYNTTMAPRPITESVENVFINALAQGNFGANNSGTVTSLTRLNADAMDDLEQLWSNGSEASLRVENVANPGDTEDLTIGMRSTGNAGSLGNRNESDYEVYFDEIELTAGSTGQGGFYYDILNQDAFDADNTRPVEDFPLESLRFDISFGGATAEQFRVSFENGDLAGVDTHAQLVAALNVKLSELRAADSRLDDLTFELQGVFSDGDGRNSIPRIQLTDNSPSGREIVDGAVSLSEEAGRGNLYWDRDQVDTTTQDLPVTATVILDDVGRQSDGGFLRVGSMSEASVSSTGIEVYDLTVQRDSSLSGLFTTNFALDEIHITSGAGFDGDLAIGNNRSAATVTQNDLDLIQTNDFDGNLTLGTIGSRVNDLTTLDTVDMGAEQSTTFWASIRNDEDMYSYATGLGDDVINLTLNTEAIDTVGTGLSINTNSGNDTVILSSTGTGSQLTQSLVDGVTINTGAGDDYVLVSGDVRTNINASSGSDFVEFDGGLEGRWTFGQATGPQNFGDRVLYQADLTLTFAGFESTVKVQTDASGLFIANQMDINDAIVAAIEANPELVRLLDATYEEGTQRLIVDSTVGGLNDLRVEINQPTVVANNAVANQVNVPNAAELNALIQGLMDTNVALDSDDFTNGAADVVGQFGTLGYNGNVDANGGTTATDYAGFAAGGSADAVGGAINFSVVDMGTGTNDLLVLDSNDNSANVLEVSAAFGKVSVVNFHDISPNGVTANTEVGNHAIDFTAFLTNQVDPSATANTNSVQPIAVTLNTNGQLAGSAASTGTALANSVNMLNFDGTVANTIAFANLSAADLVATLNNAPAAGIPVVGGINNTTLNAVNTTANLIGNVQNHIVMVENNQNPGEYKVFSLTSTIDATTLTTAGEFDANSAELLGTMDFGASINFQLVGSTAWDTLIETLLEKADGVAVDLTLAQALAEDAAGTLNYVYNITDIATAFNGVAVADAPTPAEQNVINSAANVADYVLGLSDTAANLLANLATVTTADTVAATDALTVAEALTLYTANNNSTYAVEDTAANIVSATQPQMDAASAVSLTAAEVYAANVANASTLVGRLTDTTGLTLDVSDTADAIATAIVGGADLSAANSIEHTGVDAATAAAIGTDTVADSFVFAAGADATITTFTDGEDVIDIQAITGADVGFEALTAGGGAAVQIEVTDVAGNAVVAFDTNDDGAANFTITLTGFAAADVDIADFSFA